MLRVRRSLGSVCGVLVLTGCSLFPVSEPRQELPEPPPTPADNRAESFPLDADCGGRFSPEQRMYLELVHKMVQEGQYYAALAHLDQLERTASATPQTDYLRAEALRGTRDRGAEAERLYRSLLKGCMAGQGFHGLGLLAAEAGRMDSAEDFMRRALREKPVNAEAHNDLGMVFLLRGRFASARQEFLTAVELNRTNRLPVENLIVLMLLNADRMEAQRLAAKAGLSSEELQRLSHRALRLSGQVNPAGNPKPSQPRS